MGSKELLVIAALSFLLVNSARAQFPPSFEFKSSLYETTDHVAVLNNTNFYETITGKDHAWLLELYSSYCGHCIKFAPQFKAFVRGIVDWGHTIRPAVLNCAMLENGEICRSFKIIGYPTLVLLSANVAKEDKGIKMGHKKTDPIMRAQIIDFVTKEQSEGKGQPGWMNLLPLSDSIDELFTDSPEASEGIVIVDSVNSTAGREALMDLGFFKNHLALRWMPDDSEFLQGMPPSSLPAALMISKHKRVAPQYLELDQPSPAANYLSRTIIEKYSLPQTLLPSHNIVEEEVLATDSPNTDIRDGEEADIAIPGLDDDAKDKEVEVNLDKLDYEDAMPDSFYTPEETASDKVYLVDVENTLFYSLQQEVGIFQMIENEKLDALKLYISTLLKYLPARPKVHAFLSELSKRIGHYNRVMTHSQYQAALNAASERGLFPEMRPWIRCKGSQSQFRGYPCGLWTTFHLLTVNAYALEGKVDDGHAMETLIAVYEFVKHFMSCRHCSEHFQEMFLKDAEQSVAEPSDSVMWLWEAHNKVNKRLAGDETEDPKHPKVIYPTKAMCPKCYSSANTFNKEEVLKFLLKTYAKESLLLDNVVHPGRRGKKLKFDEMLQRGIAAKNEGDIFEEINAQHPPQKSIFWSLSEISTCMLLYSATTLVIAALYLTMVIRRRIKRKRFIEMCKNP